MYITYRTKRMFLILMKVKQPGDIIITMGAGDIWRFGEEFIRHVKKT